LSDTREQKVGTLQGSPRAKSFLALKKKKKKEAVKLLRRMKSFSFFVLLQNRAAGIPQM
jgi:hypothetical protein